jgi:hypothetical protein
MGERNRRLDDGIVPRRQPARHFLGAAISHPGGPESDEKPNHDSGNAAIVQR